MCGAPTQTPTLPAGIDLNRETVIYGVVSATDGAPVAGAYVRLLDKDGEFTGEVQTSASGDYRFFAMPGKWSLSVLAREGRTRRDVVATGPGLIETPLVLEAA